MEPAPGLQQGQRTGHGTAHGAVTILNATATGIGCSLAIHASTMATWTPAMDGLHAEAAADTRLVDAVAAGRSARVTVACPFPPGRGLKTSSSVAAALVRSLHDAEGTALDDATVERESVAACRRAGVTLTGAFDDQAAVVRGGCHLTDNRGDRILTSLAVEPWQVALWVPARSIDKSALAGLDLSGLRPAAEQAAELAREGRIAEAMTANGAAFHAAYAAAGLPVDDLPARVALGRGALGAGLSGTGPAVAALFARRTELPPVAGGTWQWTRAVPSR
jgi:shikimate kinase